MDNNPMTEEVNRAHEQNASEELSIITEIHDNLMKREKGDKAQMYEFTFVKDFISMFDPDIPESDILIGKWIEFAGGPYRSAELIDNQGKVVFLCPPILSRGIAMKDNSVIDINSIGKTYNLLNDRHSATGDNFSNQNMSELSKNLEINDIEKKQWANIIAHYRIQEILAKEKKTRKEDVVGGQVTESVSEVTNERDSAIKKKEDDNISYD